MIFNLLNKEVDKHKLTPDHIFNCDESAISVNPKGHSKMIATWGKWQVGVSTSAEHGETVTVELCYSASVSYTHLLEPLCGCIIQHLKMETIFNVLIKILF